MNGTSYGTVTSGKSSFSASSASASGGSAQPKPTPNASPASPCPARRRTYSRCGRESSPTPSPVVISSSPPSSHGVGSGSSETWTQRITFAGPARARRELQPESRQRCDLSDGQHRAVRAPLGREGQVSRRLGCASRARAYDTVSKPHSGPLARRSIAFGRGRGRESPCVSPGRTAVDDVLEARARYVARGVSTPKLVVTRAVGAQVEAADGTLYLDFAGGIACQNTGHGFAPVVAAIHEQVDRFLHQCFMVGTYEPYVEVCRRLAEHSPVQRAPSRSRSSSTRAPRRSRTRSRSRAPPPAALLLSFSTTASTAARS